MINLFCKRALLLLLIVGQISFPLAARCEETLSAYCRKLDDLVIPLCESSSRLKQGVCVEICIDKLGQIDKAEIATRWSNVSDASKNAALELIGSLGKIDAPPGQAPSPLCLSVYLSKKIGDVFINVRGLDFKPYMDEVQRRIKHHWFPPKYSETKSVELSFLILPDGNISDLKISNSSGVDSIDQSGLEAVQGAVPFDQPPDGYAGNLHINFALHYNVHHKGD